MATSELSMKTRMVCAIFILAALAFRIAIVVYYTPRQSWTGDPAYYLKYGRVLAATGAYSQDPRHDKMPGMAALVAVGCQLGESGCRYVPLILFAVCGTVASVGLWWLLLPSLRPTARIPALTLLLFGVPDTSPRGGRPRRRRAQVRLWLARTALFQTNPASS
jgi:hypothetical protein